MNVRPLLLVILFLSLSGSILLAQPLSDLTINPELEIREEDNHNNVIAKFVFPNMTTQDFDQLSEAYVEFSLIASITNGTIWPAYLLEVHCLNQDITSAVGNIEPSLQGELIATHFWKSTEPQNHLRYDELKKEYYVDLTIGFCDPNIKRPSLMIGYVDIILNASDRMLGGIQSLANHCAQLDIEITTATFKTKNERSYPATQMGAATIEHGANCTNFQSETREVASLNDMENKNNKAEIYPNPAVDYLHIQYPGNKNARFYIYHSNGQLVYTKMRADQLTSFSIRDLEAGLYFLHIQTDEGSEVHKFIAAPSQ